MKKSRPKGRRIQVGLSSDPGRREIVGSAAIEFADGRIMWTEDGYPIDAKKPASLKECIILGCSSPLIFGTCTCARHNNLAAVSLSMSVEVSGTAEDPQVRPSWRGPIGSLRPSPAPTIPMLLWCPECGERHVDEGEFATRIHSTHACQNCGHCWRPAIVPTVGVRFLPGFKNP
jgi:hypothetical protein